MMEKGAGLPRHKVTNDSEEKGDLDSKPRASRQVNRDLHVQGTGSDPVSKTLVVTHNERWEDAFNRLKAFQREHGHCEVPFRYAPDTRLGRWGKFRSERQRKSVALDPRPLHFTHLVAFQRTMYRRMREGKSDTVSLTQERIRRLEEIGFEWTVRSGSKLSTWELRFNDLVNFKVSHRRFLRTSEVIFIFLQCVS
jgi:hypothetical protein